MLNIHQVLFLKCVFADFAKEASNKISVSYRNVPPLEESENSVKLCMYVILHSEHSSSRQDTFLSGERPNNEPGNCEYYYNIIVPLEFEVN